MTTKILALTDALGNLVHFVLLLGHRFDTVGVPPLIGMGGLPVLATIVAARAKRGQLCAPAVAVASRRELRFEIGRAHV